MANVISTLAILISFNSLFSRLARWMVPDPWSLVSGLPLLVSRSTEETSRYKPENITVGRGRQPLEMPPGGWNAHPIVSSLVSYANQLC